MSDVRNIIMGLKKDEVKIPFNFDDKTTIYIKEPSIKHITKANELRFEKKPDGTTEIKEYNHIDTTMFHLIHLVVDENDEAIFNDADKDTIFNHGATSKFAYLIQEVLKVTRGEYEKK